MIFIGLTVGDEGLVLRFGSLMFPELPTFSFKSIAPSSGEKNNTAIGCSSSKSSKEHVQDQIFQKWLHHYENLPDTTQQTFLLCDVCVGVPYVIQNWKEASYFKRFSLPDDYDSVLIVGTQVVEDDYHNQRLTYAGKLENLVKSSKSEHTEKARENLIKNSMGTLPPASFHLGIKIFDATQVYPRFLASIDVNLSDREEFLIPMCNHCHEAPAQAFCVADDAK